MRNLPNLLDFAALAISATICGGTIAPAHNRTAEYLSMYTHQKYGKELCAECAAKEKAKLDAQKAPDPFKKEEGNDV